jgi:ADP-ribose pyrophosphatase YjhB (NUDIX family)
MQRYKVFINEHSISFIENLENSTIVDNSFHVFEPSDAEIKVIVNQLLIETEKMEYYFSYSEIESHFSRFKSAFEIVEAAGGKVRNSKNEILFIHRLGKWDLPKGKIEIGEDQRTAAIREVEEECGISQLEITSQLPTTFHIYKMKERLILKPTYWFAMTCEDDSELIPQTEEAIEKAVWIKEGNLEEQLCNTYASLVEIIANY